MILQVADEGVARGTPWLAYCLLLLSLAIKTTTSRIPDLIQTRFVAR